MGKPWFNPKRYGYGAGLPCSWEGWLLMAGYLAIILGGPYLLIDADWRLKGGIMAVATIALIVICAAKTRGGWRWRWGQD